jgi:hypothetical protein
MPVTNGIGTPNIAEHYYNACGRIDKHNRLRPASLMLERKVKTLFWHRRVNTTIFGMCVVDAYHLMCGSRGLHGTGFTDARSFFNKLAEDLIDNNFETRNLRKRADRLLAANNPLSINTDSVLDANLQTIGVTPTKKYKKTQPTKHAQGLCMVCKGWTIHVCRECQRFQVDPRGRQFFVRNKPGQNCMGQHILCEHPHAVRGI